MGFINSIENHQKINHLLFSDSPKWMLLYDVHAQQQAQKDNNVTFQEKSIDLMMLTSACARELILAYYPSSYCLYRSESHINVMLTMKSVDDLYLFEYEILDDYRRIVEHFKATKNPTVHLVLNFIHMHLQSALSLDDIARKLELNKFYVSSLFKDEMGESITTYIHRQKIERLKEVLTYTTEPLIQISEIYGFGSYSYFSKIFKEFTQESPKQYFLKYNIHKK